MRMIRPDRDLLEAYVAGMLPEADAEAVRNWFIGAALPEDLELYENVVMEHERREASLNYWAAHPLRAKALNSWSRLRKAVRLATVELGNIAVGEPGVAAASARLGRHPAHPPAALELAVGAGDRQDPILSFDPPCYVLVVAIDDAGRLHRLSHWRADTWAPPGETVGPVRLALKSLSLHDGDGPVELIALFDRENPLTDPPADADATWLVERMNDLAARPSSAWTQRLTFTLAPSEPDRG